MEQTAEKIKKTEAEWKQQLTPEQYHVTREAGTECAFTGKYWDNHEAGAYHCVCCGAPLFDSQTKFNSGTGWPSFYKPSAEGGVVEHRDSTYGMAVRKFAVPSAMLIWDTCSKMGRHPPGCDIA